MSGGSMGYFYSRLEEAAGMFRLNTMERIALQSHMLKLAKALQAVEWNDSGDGDDDETRLIIECLAPREVLATTIIEAKKMIKHLEEQINKAWGIK